MDCYANQPRMDYGQSGSCFERDFPVGMAYVPWQQWNQTYNLAQGLQRGTIFPELDYPFSMGRCR